MTAAGPDLVLSPRARPVRVAVQNPVLLVLVVAALVAVTFGGFVALAPNRLVSGRPIALWVGAQAPFVGGLAILALGLLAVSLRPAQRRVHLSALALSGAVLLLALLTVGEASRSIAAVAPKAARVAPGLAFWAISGCAVLAVGDALQRLRATPALRLAVAVLLTGAGFALALLGEFDALSIAREYQNRQALFAAALLRHIVLVAATLGPALVIGLPLGVAAARYPAAQGPIFAVLNLLQTIPSIALFGLLIAPLSVLAAAVPALAAIGISGIGMAPALIALVLYALLPVVRNTAAGIAGVEPAVIDAARGMGMSRGQVFRRVELPLALPVLLAGLRIVIVQTIGLAVVAALIGAGGLGTFVFEGLGQYAVDLVLLGALPTIFLALAADFGMQMLTAALRRRAGP